MLIASMAERSTQIGRGIVHFSPELILLSAAAMDRHLPFSMVALP
jgi:hypothetical protein